MHSPVMYLSYDGLSDAIGQSQVLPYLRGAHKKGIPLHLVTFEKKEKAEEIARIQQVLDEEGIVWHRLQFTQGRGLHLKIYDFLRFVIKATTVSVRNRCKVIHSRSYFASIVGLLIKRMTGKKLIFDKRDFWIDAIVETGRLNLDHRGHRAAHKWLRRFEKQLFERSDQIISLTYAARDVVLHKYPERDPDTITVIPCCADLKLFDRSTVSVADRTRLLKDMGLSEGPVFGYVGSVGPAYMIPEMLDCFKQIRQTMPTAKMLILVNNNPEEIFNIAKNKNIPLHVLKVTRAPRAQMPLYISLMDYGIFFIMPSFGKKATSPTKQYELLAMGKSIISNVGVGDAEKVFGQLSCGYLIKSFDTENYAAAVDWIVANPPEKETAYELCDYSLDYGVEKYYQVYLTLLNEK